MPAFSVAVPDIEAALLDDVSVDVGWSLIEHFATLVRESGMPAEHAAADYVVARLAELGIDHEVFEPPLYLSLPRGGSVRLHGREGESFGAKPPAFAASTTEDGVTAEAVYLPAPPMRDLGEIFEDKHQGDDHAVRGKIVVTNGYAMPSVVKRFEEAGAVAQVFVNPGNNVHWGICTTIWGTPTHANIATKPKTPVVAVNRPDGQAIIEELQRSGGTLTVRATLEEGWYPCRLPVATIRGRSDEYVLVHGHYDSWDVGIGDNAVGDATLLELARIFSRHQDQLERTLKIAWWPGHSTGRYAGSTWYADEFGLDLHKRCVAAVNIDSPGCWHAGAFEDVMWMAETDALCRGAIHDRTGQNAGRRRPIRAGDYSFNQIGLTSFFMLLSNIPAKEREELEFYAVGGCGGNIAWHTEDDVMGVASREYLEQDLRVYVTAVGRVLNSRILPFDFRGTVGELRDALKSYQHEAGDLLDLSGAVEEARQLQLALDVFYDALAAGGLESQAAVNQVLVDLSRILVPVGFARGARFQHDPAIPLGVIPKLEEVSQLRPSAERRDELLPFLQAGLKRLANEVAGHFCEAAQVVRSVS